MSGEKSNIEIILDSVNSRLDRLTDLLDKLQSHQTIVPQLMMTVKKMSEDHVKDRRDIDKLMYDSERRDDIKKSITNPLIMRSIWSILGAVVCCLCIAVGFSFKNIDIKSNVERQKLIGR